MVKKCPKYGQNTALGNTAQKMHKKLRNLAPKKNKTFELKSSPPKKHTKILFFGSFFYWVKTEKQRKNEPRLLK
jgi:hypothetical protein